MAHTWAPSSVRLFCDKFKDVKLSFFLSCSSSCMAWSGMHRFVDGGGHAAIRPSAPTRALCCNNSPAISLIAITNLLDLGILQVTAAELDPWVFAFDGRQSGSKLSACQRHAMFVDR